MLPKLSVCIPAYNRAKHLPALLDSILSQEYPELEVVICEDRSPERDSITQIVRSYQSATKTPICYFQNEATLGFDGNLRNLFARSTGEYCVMMGNDDLLCPGSLHRIGALLATYPQVGVAIRSYGWFHENPSRIEQVVKYFPQTSIFSPGEDTIVTFFRRVGVLAGLVFRRQDAMAAASTRFDGTLYYQMYIAGKLLAYSHGLYIAEPIAMCRENKPDFGQSTAEKGRFKPGEYTAGARVTMIRGMLEIARYVDTSSNSRLYGRILRDVGNYSFYFLAFQADCPFSSFWRYYRDLGNLGFDRNPLFHLYFWSLALFGRNGCEAVVKLLRKALKATPRLGKIAEGHPADGLVSDSHAG